jgi:hypothetical protein
MMRTDPRALIVIGLVLVVLGFVMPFLMVLRIIEPSLALSFMSHAASVSGLFLGIIGSAMYIRIRKG